MVNINHREAAPYPGDDNLWEAIWKEQEQLHLQYRKIETETGIGYGLIHGLRRDIDHSYFQYYIKDLMWRFTEEMQEAKEAIFEGKVDHFHEELIDALHFIMELNVVLDIYPKGMFVSHCDQLDPIFYLGLAANCLKNKPWKRTFQATDRHKFFLYILRANTANRDQLYSTMSGQEIWENYSKKHQVNEFRIGSQY